jgi:formylglycine-generating enzyme required for sulfatase activity
MVSVPAGPFLRGSPKGQGLPEETPQRTLFVSAFEIDRLPVTWADFERFREAGGYGERGHWSEEGWSFVEREKADRPRFHGDAAWGHVTGATQPVCGVSFWEAEAFARFAAKRLPTEAEWEKAARGTDGRTYPWGDEWEPGRCSVRGGAQRAAPAVGSFPLGVSPYGAFDMVGGVWEWCQDWFALGYYQVAPDRDPPGPPTGTQRVARGGAWSAPPLLNRTANRNAWKPSARFSNLGFRCVR